MRDHRATAARACRSASRSLSSSETTGRRQTEAATKGPFRHRPGHRPRDRAVTLVDQVPARAAGGRLDRDRRSVSSLKRRLAGPDGGGQRRSAWAPAFMTSANAGSSRIGSRAGSSSIRPKSASWSRTTSSEQAKGSGRQKTWTPLVPRVFSADGLRERERKGAGGVVTQFAILGMFLDRRVQGLAKCLVGPFAQLGGHDGGGSGRAWNASGRPSFRNFASSARASRFLPSRARAMTRYCRSGGRSPAAPVLPRYRPEREIFEGLGWILAEHGSSPVALSQGRASRSSGCGLELLVRPLLGGQPGALSNRPLPFVGCPSPASHRHVEEQLIRSSWAWFRWRSPPRNKVSVSPCDGGDGGRGGPSPDARSISGDRRHPQVRILQRSGYGAWPSASRSWTFDQLVVDRYPGGIQRGTHRRRRIASTQRAA